MSLAYAKLFLETTKGCRKLVGEMLLHLESNGTLTPQGIWTVQVFSSGFADQCQGQEGSRFIALGPQQQELYSLPFLEAAQLTFPVNQDGEYLWQKS